MLWGGEREVAVEAVGEVVGVFVRRRMRKLKDA